MRIAAAATALLALAQPAQADDCTVPDEGTAPLRRAVAQVKYLPETEAWAEHMARNRMVVQYVLSVDEPRRIGGRCYWPVEVRAGGRLWKRFFVRPGGGSAVEDRTASSR